jgi:hypothetical protein
MPAAAWLLAKPVKSPLRAAWLKSLVAWPAVARYLASILSVVWAQKSEAGTGARLDNQMIA